MLVFGSVREPAVEVVELPCQHSQTGREPVVLSLQSCSLAEDLGQTYAGRGTAVAPCEVCQTTVELVEPRSQAPQQLGQLFALGRQLGQAPGNEGRVLAGGVLHGSRTGHGESLPAGVR